MPFRDVPYLEPNIKFETPMIRLEYAESFGARVALDADSGLAAAYGTS